MEALEVKIAVTDLPQFKLFKNAAPDWMRQVTQPGYTATDAEKNLFGALCALAEAGGAT